jgi:hypothetical protein
MKNVFNAISLIVGIFLVAPSIATADCTRADGALLLSCADTAVNSCRATYPTCSEPARAVTVLDTLDAVTTKCCAIHGRRVAERQRDCFLVSERRLARMYPNAEPTLKKLIKKTQSAITAQRKNGCSSGSLN